MNTDQIDVIRAATDYPEVLTAWEYDWANDVGDEYEDLSLSNKQVVILERIQQKLEDANLL